MKWLHSLMSALDGYKSYALLLGGLVLWLGWVAGWWSLDQVKELFALLALLGLGAARSAAKKLEL